jgi:hypothetical protein
LCKMLMQQHLLQLPSFLLLLLALVGADIVAAGLKSKPFNLDLYLKDNTQMQFPVVVSSPSSLSSKAPNADPVPGAGPVSVNEVALELKATGYCPLLRKSIGF